MDARFVDLAAFLPELKTEIRYATAHNLTGHPLAGYLAPKAFATLPAAHALAAAFRAAQGIGYGFLIYDAYRPQKAVDDLIRWGKEAENNATKAEFYPGISKADLFPLGYIAERSGHSRGSTIDLTLTDEFGEPVDMGGHFDLMDIRSHHGAPGLTSEQEYHRAILRGIMAFAGFAPYENEWWHYRLMSEPFPETYFHFDIV